MQHDFGVNGKWTSPSQGIIQSANLLRMPRFVFCAGGRSVCSSVSPKLSDCSSLLTPRARPDGSSPNSRFLSGTALCASATVANTSVEEEIHLLMASLGHESCDVFCFFFSSSRCVHCSWLSSVVGMNTRQVTSLGVPLQVSMSRHRYW